MITAWGNLVSADNWNECNTAGATFGVEDSTLSATFYPSLFFESKVGGVPQKHWLTFSKECSLSAGYSVFALPELPSGAFTGFLWYSVKKTITSPRGMQDALSLPFSYDLPVVSNLKFAQPAAVGGSLTVIGNNFRELSVPFSVAVGATACFGISLVHPHTAFKCSTKPFFDGPSSRLNVSIIFDIAVAYVWRGFSFGDVRGIVLPTPLIFQNALTGASIIQPFVSQSLGARSTSLFASIHVTSCAYSAWLSDTSLNCKVPSGFVSLSNSSLRVSLASAGSYRYQKTFFAQNPSCQFLELLQAVDGSFRSATGSNSIAFLSGGLGINDNSVKSRIDGTFCVSSLWYSDSGVVIKTSPYKKQSSIVVLSVSKFVTLCPVAKNISLSPVAGNMSTLHSSTSGPNVVFVNAIGMGPIDTSLKLRLSSSASSMTTWASDSHMVGKTSTRAVQSFTLSALLTISNRIMLLNATQAQSLLSNNISIYGSPHVLLSNFPSSGTLILSLMLSTAGLLDASPRISRSFSACAASLWKSESSIICKAGAEFPPATPMTISIQMFRFERMASTFILLAMTNANTSQHFELASTGGGMITLQCQNLGLWSSSKNARLHQSACRFSSWMSESAIICKPHLVSRNFAAIIISSDRSFPSGIAHNSWRHYIMCNSTNAPYSGSSIVSIFGFGLLSHDVSSRVRIAGSACDATNWNSDSNINTKVPSGKGFFAIAVSLQNDRRDNDDCYSVFDFQDFSFVPFSYMYNLTMFYPSTGGLDFNLIGSSASKTDQSGSVRLR